MIPMTNFATVCSGVECVSLAWEPLGMTPVFFSEHNPEHPWPAHFLAQRFPHVPNLGDMLKLNGREYEGKLDVLWGSTPCQAFSLAGLRRGIIDPRGGLTMKFIDLADDINPDFLCWENVPGALTDDTNAFGCLLGGLAGEIDPLVAPGGKWSNAGWVDGPRRQIAWRLLDAQYFGLAQHRERVVLVACPTGSGLDPRRVLFERCAAGDPVSERLARRATPVAGSPGCVAAYAASIRGRKHGQQLEIGDDLSHCIRASQGGSDKPMALVWDGGHWRVRILTPVECERLMGMPDGWTDLGDTSDSVRYHAIGNGVAVPMVQWVGRQIQAEMKRRAVFA